MVDSHGVHDLVHGGRVVASVRQVDRLAPANHADVRRAAARVDEVHVVLNGVKGEEEMDVV